MSRYRLAVLPGDGIGPEITHATIKVLEAVERKFGVTMEIVTVKGGDSCLAETGKALPDETVEEIRRSDVCMKGPVGETAKDVIVKLRQIFDLYVNLRPARCYPGVECISKNIDFVIVRENTEDLYKGLEYEFDGVAIALRVISEKASMRVAEYAFKLAQSRQAKKSVVAVHKRNVMPITDGVFSRCCRKVAARHPDISFSEMYVDAAAMNLIRRPEDFDVIVTTNMFGDILSDEAAMLVGGLGIAPSANIGDRVALFEPVHGSAPDIAGKGVANPLAMILTAKMMYEWLGINRGDSACTAASLAIDQAVVRSLRDGVKGPDLGGVAGTNEVANAIVERLSS